MSALARSPQGLVVVGGTGALLVSLAAAVRLGPVALALPAVAGGAVALLRRPDIAVGAFIGAHLLAEADPESFMGTSPLHEGRVASLSAIELLGFLAVAAVALDCLRRRRLPPVPAPLVVTLGLVAAAMATGLVTGWYSGGDINEISSAERSLLFLVATPLLVLAVVRTPDQARRVVAAAGVAAVLKAGIGVVAVAGGFGATASAPGGGDNLTYYDATPNWLIVLFILVVLAGVLRRARLPAWSLWLWPLAVAAVVLSYRRAFWIAASSGS